MQGKDIDITGTGYSESAVDVVLSSVGWVSITADAGSHVKLRAHTPAGRGISVRLPVLPYTRKLRGEPHTGNRALFRAKAGKSRQGIMPPSYTKAWRDRYLGKLQKVGRR